MNTEAAEHLAQVIADQFILSPDDPNWSHPADAILDTIPKVVADAQSRIALVDRLEAQALATNAFSFKQLKEGVSQVLADERKALRNAMLLPKERAKQAAVAQNAAAATLLAILAGSFFLNLIDLITTIVVLFLLTGGYQWAHRTEAFASRALQDLEDKISDLDEFDSLLANR